MESFTVNAKKFSFWRLLTIEEYETGEQVMNTNKLKVLDYLEKNAGLFTALSDYIWENPELSLKEYRSAAAYIRILKENGFEVKENLGGIGTAFSGSFGRGRPVIAFLGEFDALSGMSQEKNSAACSPLVPGGAGHGCGHNLLGAGSLAAAFALKEYLSESQREGTVVFYGCPGEEGGAAKAFLARDGEWKKLDAVLTWHPSDVNEVVTGTNNSCIQVLYEFDGTAAHAAGDPENGRSALDAVELMNTGVQYLREHMASDCRVHYAITDTGGVSPNVVQAHAGVLYMVRANKVKDSKKLLKRVDKIAQGAALMTETAGRRTFIDGTAELVPNFTLEELLYENFRQIPLPEYTSEEKELAEAIKASCPVQPAPGIGARFDPGIHRMLCKMTDGGKRALNDFLIPLVHSEGFVPGSTDVGDVSFQVPAAQIHAAAFVSGAPGHSWQNVSCGGGSIGHKALLLAAKVLACSAADLYEQPELLKKAREEFEERTKEGYISPIEPEAVPTALE